MQAWPGSRPPRLPGRPEPLRLSDSATGTPVPLARGSRVRMYVCGITPYDATHLGHAHTYVAFDLVHRMLLDAGVAVDYAQNVTDVDTPLLERARATDEDWRALADREIDRYRRDMTALAVLPPTWYVGAVEAIPDVVDATRRLLDRGAAYRLDDDVYFAVRDAPGFGQVSHLDRAEMLRRDRDGGGDPDREGKQDALDPVLWRGARPGEPAWPTALGPGRPGWHIECTAIALTRLGETVDIQGGARDLLFPHHEMGAAHAVTLTGSAPFARCFAHAGLVGLDGQKMSKSRGNLVFVSRLLAGGTEPAALRLALLAHHYRTDWSWDPAELDAATARLARWRAALTAAAGPPAGALVAELRRRLALDLDAPGALSAVDAWAGAGGDEAGGPAAAREAVDALLGVSV